MGGPFFPPSAGGGGSPTDGWEALTLGGGETIFGLNAYVATTTFTLAAGQHLEIDGFIFKDTGNNGGLIVTADGGTTGFLLSNGSDGNCFIDKYVVTFIGVTSASGISWTGVHAATLAVNVFSGNNYLYGKIDGSNIATGNDTLVDLIGTVQIFAVTDDPTQCALRARVFTQDIFQ